jgi:hypothetical protein
MKSGTTEEQFRRALPDRNASRGAREMCDAGAGTYHGNYGRSKKVDISPHIPAELSTIFCPAAPILPNIPELFEAHPWFPRQNPMSFKVRFELHALTH